eukprot:4361541-Prorocentrum_lima.AAC.1
MKVFMSWILYERVSSYPVMASPVDEIARRSLLFRIGDDKPDYNEYGVRMWVGFPGDALKVVG